MLSPLSLYQEIQSERKYLSSQERAEKYFEMQQAAISAIKDTEGYKEIRMFWVREWEAGVTRLGEVKGDDFKAVQSATNLSRRFLDFLEAMS